MLKLFYRDNMVFIRIVISFPHLPPCMSLSHLTSSMSLPVSFLYVSLLCVSLPHVFLSCVWLCPVYVFAPYIFPICVPIFIYAFSCMYTFHGCILPPFHRLYLLYAYFSFKAPIVSISVICILLLHVLIIEES